MKTFVRLDIDGLDMWHVSKDKHVNSDRWMIGLDAAEATTAAIHTIDTCKGKSFTPHFHRKM